jgi:hypothetical protein
MAVINNPYHKETILARQLARVCRYARSNLTFGVLTVVNMVFRNLSRAETTQVPGGEISESAPDQEGNPVSQRESEVCNPTCVLVIDVHSYIFL